MKSNVNRIVLAVAALSLGSFLVAQTGSDRSGFERYVTHVATDKPIYRAGEKVYVRGTILSATGHLPMPAAPAASRTGSFEIKGPKGDTVASGASTIVDSVMGFAWDIPAGQAGGEYTVRISSPW